MPPKARIVDTAHRWRLLPARLSLRVRWLKRWGGFLRIRTLLDVQLEVCEDCGLVRVIVSTDGLVENSNEFYFTGVCPLGLALRNQPLDRCEFQP